MKPKKLVKELEKQLRKDADNPVLRLRLAAALRELERFDEAVALYRSVAATYHGQGRVVQAIAVCKSVLELSPADAPTEQLLAELESHRSAPVSPVYTASTSATDSNIRPAIDPGARSPIPLSGADESLSAEMPPSQVPSVRPSRSSRLSASPPSPPPDNPRARQPPPPPAVRRASPPRPPPLPAAVGEFSRKSGLTPAESAPAMGELPVFAQPTKYPRRSSDPVITRESRPPGVRSRPTPPRVELADAARQAVAVAPGTEAGQVEEPSIITNPAGRYGELPSLRADSRQWPQPDPNDVDDEALTRVAPYPAGNRRELEPASAEPSPLDDDPALDDALAVDVDLDLDDAAGADDPFDEQTVCGDSLAKVGGQAYRDPDKAKVAPGGSAAPAPAQPLARVKITSRLVQQRKSAPTLAPTRTGGATGGGEQRQRKSSAPMEPVSERLTKPLGSQAAEVRRATQALGSRGAARMVFAGGVELEEDQEVTGVPAGEEVTSVEEEVSPGAVVTDGDITHPAIDVATLRRGHSPSLSDLGDDSDGDDADDLDLMPRFERSFVDTLGALAPDGAAIDTPLNIFAGLPEEALSELVRRMILRSFRPGEVILREGDRGDACFVIAAGSVRVLKHDPAGTQPELIEVARLGPGAVFGEFALLADRRRHATVQAVEGCELYEIPRRLLRELAAAHAEVGPALERFYRERLLSTLLATAPFFQPLEQERRSELLARFVPLRRDSGNMVIEEGKEAGGLYLIVLGAVEITKRVGARRSVLLTTLGEGSYFGELSLLRGGKARATVTATGPTELAMLPPEEFYELVAANPVLWQEMRQEANRRELLINQIVTGETSAV